MQTATDHYITALGDHRVALLEVDGDGTHLVSARRDAGTGTWTVSADGVPDVIHTGGVHALVHHEGPIVTHALKRLAGAKDKDGKTITGYTTWVPDAVRKMDGDASWRAWCASVGVSPDR